MSSRFMVTGRANYLFSYTNPTGLGGRVIRILHLLQEMSTDVIRRTVGPI